MRFICCTLLSRKGLKEYFFILEVENDITRKNAMGD